MYSKDNDNEGSNAPRRGGSKEIQKWADTAMFEADQQGMSADGGPKVYLLSMTADPLGSIAACAKMYMGEVVRDKSEVTRAERERYLADMQLTKLAMPLEAVSLHFMIENVTRGFTHQMVRTRTGAYAQESTRFAVKEGEAFQVGLPPSLMGVEPYGAYATHGTIPTDGQEQLMAWDTAVQGMQDAYEHLVNAGMPAEDARGLLPTNIMTRIHVIINLRNLLNVVGDRLCTQAQFEWRLVVAGMAQAIREYNPYEQAMSEALPGESYEWLAHLKEIEQWQYEAIAALFKPVCYQRGACPMKASFDRKCKIRDRVDFNAAQGLPSQYWEAPEQSPNHQSIPEPGTRRFLPITPREWLADPSAAR